MSLNMSGKILTPAELAAVLRDMAAVVEACDSFEGSLAYEPAPVQVDDDPPTVAPMYLARGVYRVGNSMGQGGTVVIGSLDRASSGVAAMATEDDRLDAERGARIHGMPLPVLGDHMQALGAQHGGEYAEATTDAAAMLDEWLEVNQ